MPIVGQQRIRPPTWTVPGLATSYNQEYPVETMYKLPALLSSYSGKQNTTSYRSGRSLPTDESAYEESTTQQLRDRLRSESKVTLFDTGHEFTTSCTWHEIGGFKPVSLWCTRWGSPGPNRPILTYDGPLTREMSYFFAVTPEPDYELPSDSQRVIDGSRGFRQTAPTAAEAGLAQFIAELREKLPQLIGASTMTQGLSHRTVGDEYLNVVFGVQPFIRDLEKLATGVVNAGSILRQLRRDSGRNIRRSTTLSDTTEVFGPTVTTTAPTSLGGIADWFSFVGSQGETTYVDLVQQKSWFSGAFTYHLAEANDFASRMERFEQQANKLLGSRITPATVWEITPWSWLIDWFANVGGFLTNASLLADDHVVMRYGYVMHQTLVTRTLTTQGMTNNPSTLATGMPFSYSSVYESRSKQRMRATPYGFGLDTRNFSAGKWAILGALGMTRGPKNLGL